MAECAGAPRGWRCTRKAGHQPPHACVPRRWNLRGWWWMRRG